MWNAMITWLKTTCDPRKVKLATTICLEPILKTAGDAV